MGGGSNLLFRQPVFPGLVLQIKFRGITVERRTDDRINVTVMAGENWHEFVMWCVHHNYGGLENLALIPGTVGAAPVQNIGAYGVELADHLESLQAVNIANGQLHRFEAEACRFAYRNSIFRHQQKGQWIISSVTFRLTAGDHKLNTGYGAINEWLALSECTEPTVRDVANAVIQIRSSRLPDPGVMPNAGSFFKNPVIEKQHFQRLREQYKNIPGYTQQDTRIKIPAAWLIEQCGWKGHRRANCGVYRHHALILVNHGDASGEQIMQLVSDIQRSVQQQYSIQLEPEVNILP